MRYSLYNLYTFLDFGRLLQTVMRLRDKSRRSFGLTGILIDFDCNIAQNTLLVGRLKPFQTY